MTIRTATPPALVNRPAINLDNEAFDAVLWQKGYSVLLEEARQCPCHSRTGGAALVTCQNCGGLGWVFLNPIQTRAIISNIKKNPKYQEWSEESIGTISASLQYTDRLAEYDRVTFLESVSKRSETLSVRTVDGQQFVFLTYRLQEIVDIFYLESDSLPLVKLVVGTDYTPSPTNPYIVLLNTVFPDGFNNTITITYLHFPQYLVIDLPHDMRSSDVINSMGQMESVTLPVNAILRKSHIVFKEDDFDGGVSIIDNSYK